MTSPAAGFRNSWGVPASEKGLLLVATSFMVVVMPVTAPDLRKEVPRSGRDMLGGYAFLARVADKVRAMQAGTAGEYLGFCPFSLGFLERTGVSQASFDKLIRDGKTDAELVAYFDAHVSPEQRETANRWVLEDMKKYLDEQDAEEGRT